MLVEDAMTEWKENEAPFYQVATIHIPKQSFDTPDRINFVKISLLHRGMLYLSINRLAQ